MIGLSVRVLENTVSSRLNALTGELRNKRLMSEIGKLVVNQTRKRITDEKRDPEGQSWPEWSARYAKTRHANHSLLIGTGQLRRSFAFRASIDSVEIGTSLHYAIYHQEGTEEIPERPYLGLSHDNESEIIDTVERLLLSALRSRNA